MQGTRSHPVVIVAAVTVLVISVMGAAALTGLLPASSSKLEGPGTIAAREALAPGRAEALPPAGACTHCGVIEAIRVVEVQGGGFGAYGGDSVERNAKRTNVYRITLRMDDGTYRTLSQPEAPSFSVGERARIGKGLVLERD